MINNIINSNNFYNDLNFNKNINSSSQSNDQLSQAEIKSKKRTGEIECETCSSRKYVDGSNDPGVSFKTPTNISPSESASKVYSHEREHYSRENAQAVKEDKEVLSNTITVSRAICPECGSSYVSGGQTRTVTREDNSKEQDRKYFSDKFYNDTVGKYFGQVIDTKL